MTRSWAAAVAIAVVVCAVPYEAAASSVAVGSVRGRGGADVRASLEEALRVAGHDVAARSDVDAAGATPLPASLGVEFVLRGRVRRSGSAYVADLTLARAGSRGSRRIRMRARNPEQLAERVVSYLEERVRSFEATPAEPEAPEPAATPTPEPTEPVDERASAAPAEDPEAPDSEPAARYRLAGPSQRAANDPLGFRERNVFELETSVGVLSRSLSYRDDLFGRVRGYDLGAATTLVLRSRLFPFARSGVRGLRDLGIETDSEYALVADSRRPDGQVYPTTASAWSFGLAYRYPFGRHALTGSFGYGVHSFLIDPAGPATPTNDPRPELPRVRYQTLRTGLGLLVAPIGGLVLRVGASYLAVLDAGGIASEVWFPNARVTAVEAMGGIGYRLHPALELRASAQYRRYGMDLRPELGAPFIVGGAADQYWLYTIGVAVVR
jgi:hypothetical protein